MHLAEEKKKKFSIQIEHENEAIEHERIENKRTKMAQAPIPRILALVIAAQHQQFITTMTMKSRRSSNTSFS